MDATLVDLPLGTLGFTVGDDAAAHKFTKAFELTSKPLFIHIPAQVSNEEVLDTLICSFGLRLFDSRLGGLLSLALLARGLLFITGRRVGSIWVAL